MTFFDGYGRIGSPGGLPARLVVRSFSTRTLKRLVAVGVSPRDATDCNTDAELREVVVELGHRPDSDGPGARD